MRDDGLEVRAPEQSSSDSPFASTPPQCEQMAARVDSSHRSATGLRDARGNAITLLCLLNAFAGMTSPLRIATETVSNVVRFRSAENSNFSIRNVAAVVEPAFETCFHC